MVDPVKVDALQEAEFIPTRRDITRLRNILLILALFGFVVLDIATLRRFPVVYVDEAWMASRAWGWLHTGLNYGTLDAGVWDKFGGYWTVLPLLPTLINAAFIRLFGLSVGALRLASLIAGFGLLIAIFVITRDLFRSQGAGFIAVLLVCTSLPFLYSSHLIRQDIYVATLGYGAIALYFSGQRQGSSIFSLTAGLLIGLAAEFHPNGVIFIPVILALHALDDRRWLIRNRRFWAFVGGVGLGLAGYVWLHILPYPQTYLAIMSRKSQITHTPPIVSRNPLAILQSLISMVNFLFLSTGGRILAVVVIIGIILVCRRTTAYVRALVMLIVGTMAFALLVRNRPGHYAILLTPFVDILLAGWLDESGEGANDHDRRWLVRGQVVALSTIVVSLMFVLGTMFVLTSPPGDDIDIIARRIEQVVPPQGTIMGSQMYWFDLYEHNYLSWHQIFRYEWFNPNSTFEDAMKVLHPDALVIDVYWRTFMPAGPQRRPQPGQPPNDWDRGLSKEEIKTFLERYATLEDQFNTDAYGTVEIYLIHWNDRPSEADISQHHHARLPHR